MQSNWEGNAASTQDTIVHFSQFCLLWHIIHSSFGGVEICLKRRVCSSSWKLLSNIAPFTIFFFNEYLCPSSLTTMRESLAVLRNQASFVDRRNTPSIHPSIKSFPFILIRKMFILLRDIWSILWTAIYHRLPFQKI